MKDKIRFVLTHPFFSASLLMVSGSNLVNLINYFYHIFMGRLLGPVHYGELAAVITFIGLLAVIPFSFGTIIIKFISSAKNASQIKGLINYFSKKILILSLVLFGLTLMFSYLIAQFLNLNQPMLIILSGLMFVFSLPAFLNRSVLQGVLKFKEVILSQIVEAFAKLLFGVILVWFGFAVLGATAGLLGSGIVAFFITRQFLKQFHAHEKQLHPNNKEILMYTLPVLLQTAANTSLFSSDLVLVKHFFSSFDAGIYASAATLAKTILFASAPISVTMFPFIAKRKADNQNYIPILLLSVLATMGACAVIILIFIFLPNLMINLLFGKAFIFATPYLVPFALFISFLTLSQLLINFYLSINKTKIVAVPIIAALVQIIGIYLFHQEIIQVIQISLIVSISLFGVLCLYFIQVAKQK